MDEDQKHIGGGSFAQVYLIKERSSKTPFALKILNKPFYEIRGLGKQVDAEIEAMRRVARFGAQHVVHLFDSCEEADHVYMRMELCQRNMLQHIFAQPDGHLADSDAGTWTHQLCLGLKEIHQFGFLHRDIKPENLLIGFDGSLRIADFGWCATIEDAPSEMAGTFHYMAPEVLAQTSVQTVAVDVWSGAVTMMQLCTGMMFLTSDLGTGLSTTDPHEANRRKVTWLLAEIFQRCPLAADFRPSHMSTSCWELLRHMLMPRICQRASIDECLNHPWLLNASSRRGHPGAMPACEQVEANARQGIAKLALDCDDCAWFDGDAYQDGPSFSAPDSLSTASTDTEEALLEVVQTPALRSGKQQNVCKRRLRSLSMPVPSPSPLHSRENYSANIPNLSQKQKKVRESAERCIPERTPRAAPRHTSKPAEVLQPAAPRKRAEVLQPAAPRPPRSCSIEPLVPPRSCSIEGMQRQGTTVADLASVPYFGEAGVDMLSRTLPNRMHVTNHTPPSSRTFGTPPRTRSSFQISVPNSPANLYRASCGLQTVTSPVVYLGGSFPSAQSLYTSAPRLHPRVHHFAELMPTSPLLRVC
jgi:serine/threonine protein kinase